MWGWVGAGRALGLTGHVDLHRNFRPAHVVLRPACHVLPVEVAGDFGQGQPHGRQSPEWLCQGREEAVRDRGHWLGAVGSPPAGKERRADGEGTERGMGDGGPPLLQLVHGLCPGSLA